MVHPTGAPCNVHPAASGGGAGAANLWVGSRHPHPLTHTDPQTDVAAPRRRVPRLIAAVITGLILIGSFIGLTQVDVGSAGAALADADPRMLAASIALYALAQTIAGAMWAICQEAGGVRGIPLRTSLGLHWIARASCELLPASLGEVVRVAAVRRHPVGAAAGGWRITGAIAGTKAIDAAVTGAVVLAVAIATPLPGPAASLRWSALAVVILSCLAVVAWRSGRGAGLLRLVPTRLRDGAARLAQGAGVLNEPGAARTAAMLSLVSIAARLMSLAALLAAFGAPPQAAALAFSVIVLAGILPGAPGGAGAREVLLIPALALAFGMPAATALAFSIAVQATGLGVSLVVGGAALAWLGPQLARPETLTAASEPALPAAASA